MDGLRSSSHLSGNQLIEMNDENKLFSNSISAYSTFTKLWDWLWAEFEGDVKVQALLKRRETILIEVVVTT